MAHNLEDFYLKLQNPLQGGPAPFELASTFRFNVDISLTKPNVAQSKISNAKFFEGNYLSLAAQSIDIPDITTPTSDATEQPTTHTGFLSLPDNSRVFTADNEVTIKFLNSVYAPHENFFFNWLRETRSYVWTYDDFPFSKGNIDVLGYSNSDEPFIGGDGTLGDFTATESTGIVTSYKFIDVFPVGIETFSYDQELSNQISRSVTFRFNYMTVNNQDLSEFSYNQTASDTIRERQETRPVPVVKPPNNSNNYSRLDDFLP